MNYQRIFERNKENSQNERKVMINIRTRKKNPERKMKNQKKKKITKKKRKKPK